MQETQVWSLGREDPLEKGMATHSSTLTWRIPWKEEPGGLQSKRSQRAGHDWATSLSLSLFTYFQLHQFAHTFIISLTLLSLTSLFFFFFLSLLSFFTELLELITLSYIFSTLLDGSHIESSKFISIYKYCYGLQMSHIILSLSFIYIIAVIIIAALKQEMLRRSLLYIYYIYVTSNLKSENMIYIILTPWNLLKVSLEINFCTCLICTWKQCMFSVGHKQNSFLYSC